MFTDFDEMIECPACLREQAWEECLMGPLGNRIHFRCQCCGCVFSQEAEEEVEA